FRRVLFRSRAAASAGAVAAGRRLAEFTIITGDFPMYDLIVIGTGPGGYHAAIRVAQLGLNVAAIEAGDVGGVCLNTGCIPTKALLHAAGEIEHARRAAEYGLAFGEPAVDLEKLAGWRDGIVGKLAGGVASLLRSHE